MTIMTRSKPYVLIAEDDSDDVDFFISVFSKRCPEVEIKHISNGQSVLDYLDSCPVEKLPAVMLLDYKMPLASAADVLRFLRDKSHFDQITKAVWSTSGRPEEVEECCSLGAMHFFIKPASETEWEGLVARISHYFS